MAYQTHKYQPGRLSAETHIGFANPPPVPIPTSGITSDHSLAPGIFKVSDLPHALFARLNHVWKDSGLPDSDKNLWLNALIPQINQCVLRELGKLERWRVKIQSEISIMKTSWENVSQQMNDYDDKYSKAFSTSLPTDWTCLHQHEYWRAAIENLRKYLTSSTLTLSHPDWLESLHAFRSPPPPIIPFSVASHYDRDRVLDLYTLEHLPKSVLTRFNHVCECSGLSQEEQLAWLEGLVDEINGKLIIGLNRLEIWRVNLETQVRCMIEKLQMIERASDAASRVSRELALFTRKTSYDVNKMQNGSVTDNSTNEIEQDCFNDAECEYTAALSLQRIKSLCDSSPLCFSPLYGDEFPAAPSHDARHDATFTWLSEHERWATSLKSKKDSILQQLQELEQNRCLFLQEWQRKFDHRKDALLEDVLKQELTDVMMIESCANEILRALSIFHGANIHAPHDPQLNDPATFDKPCTSNLQTTSDDYDDTSLQHLLPFEYIPDGITPVGEIQPLSVKILLETSSLIVSKRLSIAENTYNHMFQNAPEFLSLFSLDFKQQITYEEFDVEEDDQSKKFPRATSMASTTSSSTSKRSTCKVRGQALVIAEMLFRFLENVDHLEDFNRYIDRIAAKHVARGVMPDQYVPWGRGFLTSIEESLGSWASKSIMQAWEEAYLYLANRFIQRENEMREEMSKKQGGWTGFRKFKVNIRNKLKKEDTFEYCLVPDDGQEVIKHTGGQFICIRFNSKEHGPIYRNYPLEGTPSSLSYTILLKPNYTYRNQTLSNTVLIEELKQGDELFLSVPLGGFMTLQTKQRHSKKDRSQQTTSQRLRSNNIQLQGQEFIDV